MTTKYAVDVVGSCSLVSPVNFDETSGNRGIESRAKDQEHHPLHPPHAGVVVDDLALRNALVVLWPRAAIVPVVVLPVFPVAALATNLLGDLNKFEDVVLAMCQWK
jgi:hypothetical protein